MVTPQGEQTFITDEEGRFFAPFLRPGTYEMHVILRGFRPLTQQNIAVHVGQRTELQLTLAPGGITEAVRVTAAPPVVDVSTTTTGTVIDNATLSRLRVGRRFSDTLTLAPGVSSGGQF